MASSKHIALSVAVDSVVLTFASTTLQVLLIQRAHDPFKGWWALPGGFVEPDESLDAAALRELSEETGIRNAFIEQSHAFGAVDRDPRGRVISVAYYAMVRAGQAEQVAGGDAKDVQWFDVARLPDLAFDHQEIIRFALAQLKQKFRFEPICFELLPQQFTLTQMQRLYESVLETELDKRNFRKKVISLDLLSTANITQHRKNKRQAILYRFDTSKFARLRQSGAKFTMY